MRRLMVALAVVLSACGGASPAQAPSAAVSSAPSAAVTEAPAVTWPPAPSAASSQVPWAWTAASTGDTALIDRLCRAWTTHDVAAADGLYADGAQMVFKGLAAPGGIDQIRAGILGSPDTYERDGGVLAAIPPSGAWPGLPEGSRFLFFKMRVTSAIVPSWLLVNPDGKIVTDWEDETK